MQNEPEHIDADDTTSTNPLDAPQAQPARPVGRRASILAGLSLTLAAASVVSLDISTVVSHQITV
jgi:hypothetical protein